MDIVGNRQEIYVLRVGIGKDAMDNIFGDLVGLRSCMEIVFSIQIEIGNVVSEICHGSATDIVAFRVRRTHVGWDLSDDVAESHLVLDHLGLLVSAIERRKIGMRPSVRSDVVSIGNHSLDNSRIRGGDVNSTFPVIVTSDEESGLDAVRCKQIKQVVSVDIRAIVKSQSNVA